MVLRLSINLKCNLRKNNQQQQQPATAKVNNFNEAIYSFSLLLLLLIIIMKSLCVFTQSRSFVHFLHSINYIMANKKQNKTSNSYLTLYSPRTPTPKILLHSFNYFNLAGEQQQLWWVQCSSKLQPEAMHPNWAFAVCIACFIARPSDSHPLLLLWWNGTLAKNAYNMHARYGAVLRWNQVINKKLNYIFQVPISRLRKTHNFIFHLIFRSS